MPGASPIGITESRIGDVCIVAIDGRIDSTNAEPLLSRLREVFSANERAVLVDFGSVKSLTSAAFRVLLIATDEAGRMSIRFELCRINGHVRDLFEISGLLDVFPIHPTREEGVARLGQ